jgi:hypothetical protein
MAPKSVQDQLIELASAVIAAIFVVFLGGYALSVCAGFFGLPVSLSIWQWALVFSTVRFLQVK